MSDPHLKLISTTIMQGPSSDVHLAINEKSRPRPQQKSSNSLQIRFNALCDALASLSPNSRRRFLMGNKQAAWFIDESSLRYTEADLLGSGEYGKVYRVWFPCAMWKIGFFFFFHLQSILSSKRDNVCKWTWQLRYWQVLTSSRIRISRNGLRFAWEPCRLILFRNSYAFSCRRLKSWRSWDILIFSPSSVHCIDTFYFRCQCSLACCRASDGRLMIITELLTGATVSSLLEKTKQPLWKRMKMARYSSCFTYIEGVIF